MFPTVEVRWFYEGPVPPEITAWFAQGEQVDDELPARTDQYLCITEGDALGVKLREGRIEVKQRQWEYGAEHFHERVTGMVELWYKWSFVLADEASNFDRELLPPGSWIAVQKHRRLRRYHLLGEQRLEALPLPGLPIQGCNFELTSLRAKEQTWWSVSLEAFGVETLLREGMALVAGHIMASHQPPHLDVKHSYSYPRWLDYIGRQP